MNRGPIVALCVVATLVVGFFLYALSASTEWPMTAQGDPGVAPPTAPRRSTTTTTPAPSCDWMSEYNRGKTGQPGTWSIEPMPAGYADAAGLANQLTRHVIISPDVPCPLVHDVALHEAQHIKQAIIYNVRTAEDHAREEQLLSPYGGLEVNADCAARYLGATFTGGGDYPVVGYTDGPCTGKELEGGIATAKGRRIALS
jgi:hypothetical protein